MSRERCQIWVWVVGGEKESLQRSRKGISEGLQVERERNQRWPAGLGGGVSGVKRQTGD